jgi:hypothetical protein
VKPGDHPEFFRLPPPPGTSRESTIVLDKHGRFWHDGALVEPGPLADALHRWISVHPDDGRFILENGYDWTYFVVEETPYFVRSVSSSTDEARPQMWLSDGTVEPLQPDLMRMSDEGAVIVKVKAGRFDAKLTPTAQRELDPWLAPDEPLRIVIAGCAYPLPPSG